MKNHVLIEIKEGRVINVFSTDKDIEYTLLDHDDMETGDFTECSKLNKTKYKMFSSMMTYIRKAKQKYYALL